VRVRQLRSRRRATSGRLPPLGTLLMMVAAVAGVWWIFTLTPHRPSSAPYRKAEVFEKKKAELRNICSALAGTRWPEGAAVRHLEFGAAMPRTQGMALSELLEQYDDFRALQRNGTEEDVALCFLQVFGNLLGLHAPLDELQPVFSYPDAQGLTHVRLRQFHTGLPVYDGEVVVHLDPDRRVYRVDHRYHSIPAGFPTTPGISTDKATAQAREALESSTAAQRQYHIRPGIYVDSQHPPRLAYQVIVTETGTHREWEIWVDGDSGKILDKMVLAQPLR
jgi:hypothetical protein